MYQRVPILFLQNRQLSRLAAPHLIMCVSHSIKYSVEDVSELVCRTNLYLSIFLGYDMYLVHKLALTLSVVVLRLVLTSTETIKAIWVATAIHLCFSRHPSSSWPSPILHGAVHSSTWLSCRPRGSLMNVPEENIPIVRPEWSFDGGGIGALNSSVMTMVGYQLES